MAENYSLNSRFGLNVSQQGAKTQQVQKTNIDLSKTAADLFDSMTGYVAKYENVFNGDVEREIGMYSRQAMIVGMNLKAGEEKRHFDMNI
ncbi:MAG: hypothetical protein IKL52_06035 [Candidatus Gastranaerophilales bacterium]|jgi:hypothetical protein|nr:hypothetical protein [Candidatus Gastranaerophilales bacterium]